MLTKFLASALLLAISGWAALAPDATRVSRAPSLDVIKRLAGDWVRVDENGELTDQVVSRMRVTAGGSAVLEILFPGTDHEMVTVYHQDGDDLVLTHYCVMGNQPRLRAKKSEKENTLVYECYDLMNARSHDEKHMHKGVLEFLGRDHLKSTWYSVEKGETVYEAKFELKRRPKKAAR